MAERIADNPELLVDDMKRKARRRLVGAIVLALAAAIILPMLLEKEPRPLGDDVSVQIPPVDSGKFVNRLTGKGDDKALPKTESKAIAAAPGKPEPKAEAPATPATPHDRFPQDHRPAVSQTCNCRSIRNLSAKLGHFFLAKSGWLRLRRDPGWNPPTRTGWSPNPTGGSTPDRGSLSERRCSASAAT